MLKELGWSEDDLRRFVERWQQRKDAAKRNDPKATRPSASSTTRCEAWGFDRDKLQQSAVQKDSMRDLQKAIAGRCRSSIRSGCGLTIRVSRVPLAMVSRIAACRATFLDIWCRFIRSGFRTSLPMC